VCSSSPGFISASISRGAGRKPVMINFAFEQNLCLKGGRREALPAGYGKSHSPIPPIYSCYDNLKPYFSCYCHIEII
jgi:hypothetical protein